MDYDQAACYWTEREAEAVRMEPGALLAEMQKFIAAHNTCALATGCGEFVRCTPIEYTYLDDKFWLLSEGGLKFAALKTNKSVCLAIFDPFAGFGSLSGMQITGRADCVEPTSDEYRKLLAYKKIPAESLQKLARTLHLIRVEPVRIDFLWSGFRESGCSPRQFLMFSPSGDGDENGERKA